jgi:hypothetical protein
LAERRQIWPALREVKECEDPPSFDLFVRGKDVGQ